MEFLPWMSAPAISVQAPGQCASCNPAPSEQARLDAVLAKKQSGALLDDDERRFLEEMSSRSSKGLMSVGAGVAYSLKGAKRPGEVTPFSKSAVEVNTDTGTKLQEQVGIERPVGATGKVKVYESTNEDGSKHKSTVLYEQDLRRWGPARLQAEARGSVDQENGAVGLKLKAQQEVSVPSFLSSRVKKAEVEAYAYARVNVLNGTEKAALEARMIDRADHLQRSWEARQNAFANIEQKKRELADAAAEQAAKEAWQRRVLPPEPASRESVSGPPMPPADPAFTDTGTPRDERDASPDVLLANSA